ncbi:DNA polymerase III subunit alpha [Halalkalibacterium ligniniphilum]|uniref:DNA polymerase III subunit alpha n=1 Tax=Halalkalibacterium ligniniphilum TaxID=1134413 RepID=UPI000344F48A|nr:DNA polymerase III subunit alpha [Halalkalibacterium ligniniphilum]
MESVHLHVHSEYSLLTSICRVPQLVQQAKKQGFSALALTDKHVMYGAVPFYQACKEKGIKPIFGMETHVRFKGDFSTSMLFLAENKAGYHHLLKLSSMVQLREDKEKYLQWDELIAYTNGLIFIIPYEGGFLRSMLREGEKERAKHILIGLLQHINAENLYIEIQGSEEEMHWQLQELAKDSGIPLVASQHVHLLERKDDPAFQIVQAIREGYVVEHIGDISPSADDRVLLSPEEMADKFHRFPEALANTVALAKRCQVELSLGEPLLPKYPLDGGETADVYLRRLCEAGGRKRFEQWTEDLQQRLDHELQVITSMNYSDYFLIVWDFMRYARKRGILTGPGRGSAAGSLVAYTLFITDVDPIRYQLLFERFLNPERISLPDIDLDFPDHRRDEVIAYVQQKYGRDHVAQILTFGTLAARAAIRDVGRAIAADERLIEQLAKEIPAAPGMTLKKAKQSSERLQRMLQETEEARLIYRYAEQLEGLPRHTSIHAAGVVISPTPLTEYIALQEGQNGIPLTQGTMDVVEKVGLIKMDFLGLRNLTLIENIVKLIKMESGVTVNVRELPLDDRETFSLLCAGNTTGVFQLESSGMRRVLRELLPNRFEDIVAVNALYRPGPMENIPVYIKGKNGERTITYPHPDLESILKTTYGVIVYQEQIMQIAVKMAGFSLAEADLLRRAVGKKKRHELEEQQAHFITGARARGYDEGTAEAVYKLIVRFADYGFNRSHAVAYSMIAYQLAYLKAHFSQAFYTALLSSVWHNQDKLVQHLQEVKKSGIAVFPPSLSKSHMHFRQEKEGIRFGLLPIRNVGAQAIQNIIKERSNGAFKNLFDLVARIDTRAVGKRAIEGLIKAGALDEFGQDRAILLASVDKAFENAEQVKEFQEDTGGLFELDLTEPSYEDAEPLTTLEKLACEKQALGFYLTGHPIAAFAEELIDVGRMTFLEALQKKGTARVAGLVHTIRRIRTKKGEAMGFLTVSDEGGEWETVLFPRIWNLYEWTLREGELFFIEGKLDESRDKPQIVAQRITPLSKLVKPSPHILYLRIPSKDDFNFLEEVRSVLKEFHGTTPVILYYESEKKTIRLSKEFHIDPSASCLQALQQLLGEEHVVLKER